ncbi:LarC family nickel insertion protein [Ruminiclostridium cellobioparum]|jgi:uncharacterized protein (TIGR00299 family) protein|uniref:LarC family nickel insertion protein n=1 Tax=Ruminiclostridium cellobioparum TaxID=29355 RepID=UPI0028B21240|nr:LarC family nickel insertion protein [Ruminiclostridium cellobioparum]
MLQTTSTKQSGEELHMKLLYFDCCSGISGDMTLGALIDLGIDHKRFLEEMDKLNLEGLKFEFSTVYKNGIGCTDVNVILEDEEPSHEHSHEHNHEPHHEHGHEKHHEHRNLFDIEKIIDSSSLSERVKSLSKAMFNRLARAEAKVHRTTIENIHFHEVGALDSIADIIGTAVCIDILNPDRIMSSPLHDGTGFITCRHGIIPVPVPATMEIMTQASIPFHTIEVENELITPTGATIIATLAEAFGNIPAMSVIQVGYGSGKREMEIPGILRVVLGECNI